MRFLFVSNSKHLRYPARDASTRYRCLHPVESLNALGVHADFCTQRELRDSIMDAYDVFVFHRPRYGWRLRRQINRLSRLNRITLADYDDLLFAPELAEYAPIHRNGQASLRIARKLQQNYLEALKLFDHFTVSTSPLAEQIGLKVRASRIRIIHNGYSPHWLRQAELANAPRDGVVAGYFPGTRSHDRDFATIANPVASWLRESNGRLLIAGPLNLQSSHWPMERIDRKAHVPYRRLPSLLSLCDIALAPLERTPFNECKSGIKFIESALFGIPLIATPIPDMQRFDGHGVHLAETPGHFQEHLDAFSRGGRGDAAGASALRKYAVEHCSSMEQTLRLLSYVNGLTRWSNMEATTGSLDGIVDPAIPDVAGAGSTGIRPCRVAQ